jgi:hypothetical protein
MPDQLPVDMKICPYCGQMTSIKANFCYFCTRELVARPEHPAEEPKPFRINWFVVGIILAAVLVISILFFLR